jgi:hypothetical protein
MLIASFSLQLLLNATPGPQPGHTQNDGWRRGQHGRLGGTRTAHDKPQPNEGQRAVAGIRRELLVARHVVPGAQRAAGYGLLARAPVTLGVTPKIIVNPRT